MSSAGAFIIAAPRYSPGRSLPWQKCLDPIDGGEVLVPLAAFACHVNAGRNNPFYSRRAGRVVFSTNGLASGFSLAGALVHPTCECIERHNTKIVELQLENPGLDHPIMPPRGIDTARAPTDMLQLIDELRTQGYSPLLFDISADVKVPTIGARVIRDGIIYPGWAAHPNPTVALRAAMLEACQTVATMTAGGREDLALRTRSLGRHERPRPNRDAAFVSWDTWHADRVALPDMHGCHAPDICDEFAWVRSQLVDAGVEHLLVVDMTREELLPARVVRVLIPGLDTTNPFRCGPRARRVLAAEVLDR
jgi:ribosomal protein S12 methylthiotransferase accessory factor